MRTLISSILFASLILPAAARAAEEQPRTVSTTGDSTVYVVPDEVVLRAGVEVFNMDLDKAKQLNDQQSAKLVSALKEMKIEEKDIQTAHLEIEIRYHRSDQPILGVEGYYARRAYSITLKDTKQFEKLVDVAIKNGANRLMGFEFKTSPLRKYRDEARKMAIKAAKEKAVALAGELGCKVGAPRTISENSYGYSGYWGSSWGWYGGYRGGMAQNSIQHVEGGGSGGETMPLGELGVNATVSVSFDLLPQ